MKNSRRESAGLRETRYLLGNPVNAEPLRRSIRDAQAGRTFERELLDPDAKGMLAPLAAALDESADDLRHDRIEDADKFLARMEDKVARYKRNRAVKPSTQTDD